MALQMGLLIAGHPIAILEKEYSIRKRRKDKTTIVTVFGIDTKLYSFSLF